MSAGRAAVAVLHGDSYMVGFADRGVRGYTPTTYTYDTYDEARECARNINKKLGLTPDQMAEIVLSSMSD